MKIFVDCDILIDVGLGREPFCQASGALLDYLENNKNNGFIAWHSIANFFYDVIVSRNVKDYRNSPIRTVTPELLLQELKG
jgi:hypothetical protein